MSSATAEEDLRREARTREAEAFDEEAEVRMGPDTPKKIPTRVSSRNRTSSKLTAQQLSDRRRAGPKAPGKGWRPY